MTHTSNDALKIFAPTTQEYKSLKDFANYLNEDSTNIHYEIEDTYFDFGQNWRYTTIIAHDLTVPETSVLHSYQALSPRDQFKILYGLDTDRHEVHDRIIKKQTQ